MKMSVEKICGYIVDVIFGNTGGKEGFSHAKISTLPPAENEHEYIYAIFCYKNALAKKLIWNLKYKGDRELVKIISRILYENIIEDLSEKVILNNFTAPIVIPISATKRRMKEKGFNQCERIVKELEKLDKNNSFEIICDALMKTKETESQAHTKNKTARLNNLKNSFGVKLPGKITNRNIILIDDVWTTGATIKEARKELLEAGAKKVIAYTIAH